MASQGGRRDLKISAPRRASRGCNQDRADYAGFIIALAEEVHSRGKIITVSSFLGR